MRIHIVQKGDTLWNIAQKYGVDFEELKQMNTQFSSPDMIMPGMKVKIPSSVKNVKKEVQIKEKEMPKAKHPVKETSPKPMPIIQEDDHKKPKEVQKEMPKPKEHPKPKMHPHKPKMPEQPVAPLPELPKAPKMPPVKPPKEEKEKQKKPAVPYPPQFMPAPQPMMPMPQPEPVPQVHFIYVCCCQHHQPCTQPMHPVHPCCQPAQSAPFPPPMHTGCEPDHHQPPHHTQPVQPHPFGHMNHDCVSPCMEGGAEKPAYHHVESGCGCGEAKPMFRYPEKPVLQTEYHPQFQTPLWQEMHPDSLYPQQPVPAEMQPSPPAYHDFSAYHGKEAGENEGE